MIKTEAQKMNRLIAHLILSLLFLFSCSSEKTTSNAQNKTSDTTLSTNSTTATSTVDTTPIVDSFVSATEALQLKSHNGHANVPNIAEKAHQNPVKMGRMQSTIRRGTPKKRKAMNNTAKKKREFMEKRSKSE